MSLFHSDVSTTVREAIIQASLFLDQHQVPDARHQAEILLCFVMGWDRAKLFMELNSILDSFTDSEERLCQFDSLIERRANREPLQYLTGGQEFYGRLFQVGPGVLIPRPETEILVELSLQVINELYPEPAVGTQTVRAVDVGTGSGAIAISIGLERTDIQVIAIDKSLEALQIARSNARRLQANVQFLQGDLLEPILEEEMVPIQIVLSNPPYIPSADILELQPEVRDFEPSLALDGGEDGLDPYRRIIANLPKVMSNKLPRLAAFEVGIYQSEEVARFLQKTNLFTTIRIEPDLAGIPRVVMGYSQ